MESIEVCFVRKEHIIAAAHDHLPEDVVGKAKPWAKIIQIEEPSAAQLAVYIGERQDSANLKVRNLNWKGVAF